MILNYMPDFYFFWGKCIDLLDVEENNLIFVFNGVIFLSSGS